MVVFNSRGIKLIEASRDANGFIAVISKKRRARDVINTGSDREEEDIGAPRRALRVERPGRFITKEVG